MKKLISISLLLAAVAAGAGCRRPADNDLTLARVFQARGREGDAYNRLKRYLELNPGALREGDLEEMGPAPERLRDYPAFPGEWEEIDREEILRRYREESRLRLEELEERYSRFPVAGLEADDGAALTALFPVTVVVDRDILAVALVTIDDYLTLLQDVSVMYRDHLHYQNPYLVSGVMLGTRGYYPEAVEQFRQAIALDPVNPRAHNNLGITYFKMGEFVSARDAFIRAIELQPDNIFARNNLGLTYLRLGRREAAEENFRWVLAREPFNLAANFYMGFSNFQAGEMERAQQFYRQVSEIHPSLPQVSFALGTVMVRLERWSQALDHFQRTIALDPGFVPAYVSLGGVYLRREMYREAEEALLRAVTLEPDYGPGYYNLACLRALQGRRREAIAHLRTAIAKGFRDRAFILDDPDLASLRDEPEFRELLGNL